MPSVKNKSFLNIVIGTHGRKALPELMEIGDPAQPGSLAAVVDDKVQAGLYRDPLSLTTERKVAVAMILREYFVIPEKVMVPEHAGRHQRTHPRLPVTLEKAIVLSTRVRIKTITAPGTVKIAADGPYLVFLFLHKDLGANDHIPGRIMPEDPFNFQEIMLIRRDVVVP